MPLWNRRFTVQPENPSDAHRPLRAGHELAAILSHVEERVVSNDYTIRYAGQVYQIARSEVRPGLRGGSVRVEKRLDGSTWVRFRDRYLTITPCEARPKAEAGEAAVPPPAPRPSPSSLDSKRSPWMEGFDLRKSPPLWAILQGAAGGSRARPGRLRRGSAPSSSVGADGEGSVYYNSR